MPEDHFDGMWVGPLIDHLAGLLIKFAVLADDELDSQQKEDADKNGDKEIKDNEDAYSDEFDDNQSDFVNQEQA